VDVGGLSLPLVFLAGLVSFISPCVLPLVPGYLATVTGVGFEQISDRDPGVGRRVAVASGLFLAGFLLVFVALGASASVIGSLLDEHRIWLNRVAGGSIVVFGLAMLGLGWSGSTGARWAALVQGAARRRGGPVALGVAFAFCWTPCVGPILASVLVLAGTSGSLETGVLLLFVYGIGLAVPFLAVGLGFTRTLGSFRRIQRRYRAIQAGAGVLLVTMGSLLVTGHLYVLNVYAQRALRAIGLDWWTSL
jgi:cytochrome c-type biogenesis protein